MVASITLKQKAGEKANVTVVDRKGFFQFPLSYPWVMLGERKAEQTQRDLTGLRDKGINVVRGEVQRIDLSRKSVQVDRSTIQYDHLIIALGAEYAPERVPGFSENAHHIYDLDSALKTQKALQDFGGGKVAVGVSSVPFKCPAAPYEAVFLIDNYLRMKSLREKTNVSFFTPEGLPLPSAGPDIGNGVKSMMGSKGIDSKFKTKLKEVKRGEAIFEDGSTLPFDLLFAVPPHRCPRVVEETGLADQTGWVPVNPSNMETKQAGVYAIGDITAVSTPLGFVPFLPKAGTFARGQAEVVATNLGAQITGIGGRSNFDGSGECFLMTGGVKAGFVEGTWFATPRPDIRFHEPSEELYQQRVEFENYWLTHWL